jgi:hypothetical protein
MESKNLLIVVDEVPNETYVGQMQFMAEKLIFNLSLVSIR